MANNSLPNPYRHIVENDADGKSFFSTSLPASMEVGYERGGGLQRLGYQTEQPPVSLNGNVDLKRYETALQNQVPLFVPGGGANIWYNDLPPGAEGSLHRSVTLDIVVVLVGEIELTLSNNETRTIGPGDLVIQRSTMHKWRNPSKTQWARMLAIVSECQPYVTEKGEVLGNAMPSV